MAESGMVCPTSSGPARTARRSARGHDTSARNNGRVHGCSCSKCAPPAARVPDRWRHAPEAGERDRPDGGETAGKVTELTALVDRSAELSVGPAWVNPILLRWC